MKKKWFWIYLELLRGLLFYIVVSLTTAFAGRYLHLSMAMPNLADFWSLPLYLAFSLIFSILVVFSLAATFATNHWQMKQEFLLVAKESKSLKKRALFLLKSKAFQLEMLAFSIFFCLLYAISPFYQEINLVLSFLPLIRGARIFLAVFIALLLSLLIALWSYLSILNWWVKDYKRMINEEEKRPFWTFVGQCVLRVALFCFGGFAFAYAIPMLVMASRAIALFGSSSATFIFFFVILAVIFWILFLRPAFAKRKLIRKIKKLGKKNGFSVTKDKKQKIWLITSEKERIAFRCFSVSRRRSLLYLHSNGRASHCKDRILWNHIMTENYTFDVEEGTQKVLVIHPCRGRVVATSEEDISLKLMRFKWFSERKTSFKAIIEGQNDLESGDRMMEYTVYTAKSLLRILE